MQDVEAWVYSWDRLANGRMAKALQERCGVERVSTLCMKDHEPVVLNYALDHATASFVLIMHAGIKIVHDEFVEVMRDFLLRNPKAGLISPNREGEARHEGGVPRPWWYDGTAGLFRRCEIRFDEDFIFSQWNDVDVGLAYQAAGYTVWRDPRVSVDYRFRPFGERSAFYHAYAARNKLLLDSKWHRWGMGGWDGVDAYNESVAEERRIPTMYDLAWYGEEELRLFAESVEGELAWILPGDNPNLVWENPVVLGKDGAGTPLESDERGGEMTAGLYLLDAQESSYRENGYKWLFYGLARVYKPQVCVELGVLHGYSLCATAIGLKMNGVGIVHGYDLWEKYPYRHTSMAATQQHVDQLKLADYVRLYEADAYDVPDLWEDGSVDWVHVDISNDGEVVDWALNAWRSKLREGGLILLEGGSEERDRVEWMVEYGKEPIVPTLARWGDVYEMYTFEPFPSLTVCKLKGV